MDIDYKTGETAFSIGTVPVAGAAVLAPLSGLTDVVFRRIAKRFGAGLVTSEMVASDALVRRSAEALVRAEGEGITPHVVQLAGRDPRWMAEAARLAEGAGAAVIDINMGCPAKRVTGGYAGSALMRDLDQACRIIAATVAAARVPVTVKMRLGWDAGTLNAADLARRAASLGVAAVTVHGRTRQQFYRDAADWAAIAATVRAVAIPVTANGDVADLDGARRCLARSGAAAVMIGRAAVGRPWLVGQVAAALAGRVLPDPTPEVMCAVAREHYEGLLALYGVETGLRHARKHLGAYADAAAAAGFAVAAADRLALVTAENPARVADLLGRVFAEPGAQGGLMALPDLIMNALPLPVLTVGAEGRILHANAAAESFFDASLRVMQRQRVIDLVPFGSPVLSLVDEVRRRGSSVSEYRIDIGTPRTGSERVVDVFATPLGENSDHVVLMLQERTIADKMDRQLTHRGAARSITALGAMLAHEIKNPLSGIRGAAQLLEQSVDDDDRVLTRLICDEADRIVKLVERMELFGDERPVERGAVNIHGVLDQVKRAAQSGFARHVRFVETYDPSLPPVYGNRDQLVQVFLNLVKNAAEAIGIDALDGEIVFSTAFRTGVRLQVPGARERISLPIELTIRDNGPGIPADILGDLFDPFVTTKAQGSGLGLALVAKIVGDHGGIVECDPAPRRTTFRVLLPMYRASDGRGSDA